MNVNLNNPVIRAINIAGALAFKASGYLLAVVIAVTLLGLNPIGFIFSWTPLAWLFGTASEATYSNVSPVCPPYTADSLGHDDGSVTCLSGDGDVLIYDPDTQSLRSPAP